MKNIRLITLVLALMTMAIPVLAEEPEATEKLKHDDYVKVIKEKTKNMKKDAQIIKDAISKDFDGSTEELKAEYEKIEKQFQEFNKEISKQQKWLSQEKSKLSKKFKERQADLEEMIKSLVEE